MDQRDSFSHFVELWNIVPHSLHLFLRRPPSLSARPRRRRPSSSFSPRECVKESSCRECVRRGLHLWTIKQIGIRKRQGSKKAVILSILASCCHLSLPHFCHLNIEVKNRATPGGAATPAGRPLQLCPECVKWAGRMDVRMRIVLTPERGRSTGGISRQCTSV